MTVTTRYLVLPFRRFRRSSWSEEGRDRASAASLLVVEQHSYYLVLSSHRGEKRGETRTEGRRSRPKKISFLTLR